MNARHTELLERFRAIIARALMLTGHSIPERRASIVHDTYDLLEEMRAAFQDAEAKDGPPGDRP